MHSGGDCQGCTCPCHRALVADATRRCDATLMEILDDFHQSMKRNPDLPPHLSTLEPSASSSSACAARTPVDDWERTVEELVSKEEIEVRPATKKARKGQHKR